MPKKFELPPQCGADLSKPFYYNPYQVELLRARRLRICPQCYLLGPVGLAGVFTCAECRFTTPHQHIAKKAYGRIGIVGGRRSGKTAIGGRAAIEEVTAPKGLGWVCGPTYKILHDSTMPTFFKLLKPSWVKDWSAGNKELLLKNDHLIQFRSLDDVERGRGQGPTWSWLDEVQKMKERAWDVFRPSLSENSGNAIFTFTPNGFDWTWRRLWRPAAEQKMPGFWMAKCKTIDNPWIQRFAMDEVEEARKTMPPGMFRQEYEADFVSFTGNIYDWDAEISPLVLQEDGLKRFIPEWPKLNPNRKCVIGFVHEPGASAAAVLIVVTELGAVVVGEYINEHRSTSFHFDKIKADTLTQTEGDRKFVLDATWAYDEDYGYIATEGSRKGISLMPTEHYLLDGVQRVHSWMYTRQLWFAYTCEKTLDQMRGYRWADNDNEEKRDDERTFRKDDELPNALRAAMLSWPELPEKEQTPTGRDLSMVSDKTRHEIEEILAFEADEAKDPNAIEFGGAGFPWGSIHSDDLDIM